MEYYVTVPQRSIAKMEEYPVLSYNKRIVVWYYFVSVLFIFSLYAEMSFIFFQYFAGNVQFTKMRLSGTLFYFVVSSLLFD